jgi:hypothetical protein
MPWLLVGNLALPIVASIFYNALFEGYYRAFHPFGSLQKLPPRFLPPCP